MEATGPVTYKLLLVAPRQRFIGYTAHAEMAGLFGKKRMMIPLALPVVAAYTPDHYEIRIVDEESDSIPTDFEPDIVGITTLAATMNRAFELGDHYRARGVTVVMGGVNASVMPEEYLKHADSVVIGEAENAWESCLHDFENKCLKQKYAADPKYDYKRPRPPRWDLVNMDNIFQVAVQITRGCPFDCDFCLVSNVFGKAMRFRDIDNVIEEIQNLPVNYIFFVDDNLTINKKYAHALMKRLKPLEISWACMASIDVAEDEELLREMAACGCFNILIGFESLNPESLDETHKYHNQGESRYFEAIQRIHRAGIMINASFIVGFDNDTLTELDRIFDFTLRTGLPNVNLHLLAAPRGTGLYARLEKEGRVFPLPDNLGNGFFPTIHYMNMGQLELFNGYTKTIQRLFDPDILLEKARKLFQAGTFTRRGSPVPGLNRLKLTFIVLQNYLFTSDRHKRKLFFFLLRMVGQRRLAVDKAFAFLLSMLSINRQIRKNSTEHEHCRSLIQMNDVGPWKDYLIRNKLHA